MSDAAVAGMIAAALTWAQVGRQVYDAWRAADVAGVSEISWVLALVQSTGLVIFTIDGRFYEAAAADAFVAVACGVVLSVVGAKRGQGVARTTAPIAFVLIAAVVTAVFAGAHLAGTLGALAAAVVWLPQAMRSVSVRDDAGLSVPFVIAGFASSALWIVYAALLGQWRLFVPPISAILALAVTLVFAFHRPPPERVAT